MVFIRSWGMSCIQAYSYFSTSQRKFDIAIVQHAVRFISKLSALHSFDHPRVPQITALVCVLHYCSPTGKLNSEQDNEYGTCCHRLACRILVPHHPIRKPFQPRYYRVVSDTFDTITKQFQLILLPPEQNRCVCCNRDSLRLGI